LDKWLSGQQEELKQDNMHEMSIALGIIDVATQQARKENASKVTELELDIGTMSGVEVSALNFALEIAIVDTPLECSKVKINHIKARSECLECGHVFDADSYINPCPECNELNTKFLSGKELQVKSITIE